MIIGIDINEANIGQRVGVNQVAFELFCHLVKNNQKHTIIAFSKDRPLPDFPPPSESLIYETFGPSKAWVLTGLTKRLLIGRPRIDVLFSPSHYTPLISRIPSVIAIMDLSYEHFGSEYFTDYDLNQLRRWTPLSAKKANKIITISEFSKKEISSIYHQPEEKITVIYPGINKDQYHTKIPLPKQEQVKKKFSITQKYLLYVGTLQPRKNLICLLSAFRLLLESKHPKTRTLSLVIGGKKGWLYDQIYQKACDLNIQDKVIFTGYIPGTDLPALIKASQAYVLPSLYEGFGMPPVEAQTVGTPVVVSRVSSLPEVVGDSGIYIEDENSPESIMEAIKTAIALTPDQRKQIIQSGKQNSRRFDWDLSAQILQKTLESAVI